MLIVSRSIKFCFGQFVTVRDIVDAVVAQSTGKSAGPNGLFMESFIYACPELWVHFSLFFTACIKHCIFPVSFMDVIITPLVKNRHLKVVT